MIKITKKYCYGAVLFCALIISNSVFADSIFIKAAALHEYETLDNPAWLNPEITLQQESSVDICRDADCSQKIAVDLDEYKIVAGKAFFVTCASAKNYGINCSDTTAQQLTADYQRYLALKTIYKYYVNKAKADFSQSYNYPLQPITKSGMVSVVAYTDYDGYPAPGMKYNNGNHEIWVAKSSELESLLRSDANHICDDKNLAVERLNELYGLPPDAPGGKQRIFVFFNLPVVQSDSLTPGIFRPCAVSPLIKTTSCRAPFSLPVAPAANDPFYLWLENEYNDVAYPSSTHGLGYPWTGQGFTYNWYPWRTSAYGISEYIWAKNTSATVASKVSIDDFLSAYCGTASSIPKMSI